MPRVPVSVRHLSSFVVLLALAACASAPRVLTPPEPLVVAPGRGASPVTREVLLVADSHNHDVLGGVTWAGTLTADRFVGSALRQPETYLYSRYLLRWILQSAPDDVPVIHLGDPLDLSCSAELDAFLADMVTSGDEWVFAPGNHDGYFAGNDAGSSRAWKKACRGGKRVDKADVVVAYLDALSARRTPDGEALTRFRTENDCQDKPCEWTGQGGWPRRLAFLVDRESPWRSFVAQEVDLALPSGGPFRALLLDTAQYDASPSFLCKPAGLHGNIRENQARILRRWSEEGPAYVVGGHHGFGQLEARARTAVDTLVSRSVSRLYVSAHKHKARFIVQGKDDDSSWLEMSLGATFGSPSEARRLQLLRPQADPRRLVASVPLVRLVPDPVENDPQRGRVFCPPEWGRPGPEDVVGTTDIDGQSQRTGWVDTTAKLLRKKLLLAWVLQIDTVGLPPRTAAWPETWKRPKDVRAAILGVLFPPEDSPGPAPWTRRTLLTTLADLFPAPVPPLDPDAEERSRYRTCRALWAARLDAYHLRGLPADDELVELWPTP